MDTTRQEKRERGHKRTSTREPLMRSPISLHPTPLGDASRLHDPEALSLEPIFIGKAGLGWEMHAQQLNMHLLLELLLV